MSLLLLALLGCAPEPLVLQATPVDGGLELVASRPVERVELVDAEGAPIVVRRLPTPSDTVHLAAPLQGGHAYRLVAHAGEERVEEVVELPAVGPVRLEIEAPVGQGRRPLTDGDRVEVVRVGDGALELAVHVVATEPVEAVVAIDGAAQPVRLGAPGERATVRGTVDDGRTRAIRIEAGGRVVTASLVVREQTLAEARAELSVDGVAFPTDGLGARDRARPVDRITLPAAWWRDGLQQLGLGYRPRGDQAPWAWQAVTLRSAAAEPLSVVVRASVEGEDGPAPPFRARLRDTSGEAVTALLRVPAGGEATAVLPVFVDAGAVDEGVYRRVIEVIPLGSDRPLHRIEAPLAVTRGSRWASAGFVAAMGASLTGWLALLGLGRRWLVERRTSELVTISLFGSLTFVVGAAFQILGMGVATLLGPFAPLLTGLPDDALRACLLGTLVTLVPRPGVVSLATLVGFVMRGLALGSFHPVDLLYVGSAVFWLEASLWVLGPTRRPGWRDEGRGRRWLRLGLGLGLGNAGATATALVVSVVLYRLYFAGWYVALILALPGFLYVLAGAWIALDFAAALRRVEP